MHLDSIRSLLRRSIQILRDDGFITLFEKYRKFVDTHLRRKLSPIIRWWRYGRHYNVGLPPAWHHMWIDPDRIYIAEWVPVGKNNWDESHFIGGDWDCNKLSFENNSFHHQSNIEKNVLYNSLINYFNTEIEWENTELFSRVIYGNAYWLDIQTKKEFEKKCEEIEKLYAKMNKNGYLTYEQRNNRRHKIPKEIKVMIGRDGSFFFLDGKHRLSIAKILDIDEVAVNVIVRHKQWQQFREKIHTKELYVEDPELRDHPDLQDVLH